MESNIRVMTALCEGHADRPNFFLNHSLLVIVLVTPLKMPPFLNLLPWANKREGEVTSNVSCLFFRYLSKNLSIDAIRFLFNNGTPRGGVSQNLKMKSETMAYLQCSRVGEFGGIGTLELLCDYQA